MTVRSPLLLRAAAAALAAGALLAIAALPAAGATPVVVVRVFALKHRPADEALFLVRPVLSDAGSVMLEPKRNELTVRDTAASVEHAAQAIASYDVPMRGVDVAVTLLKETSNPKDAPSMVDAPADIRGIGENLKKRFNVAGFTRLDSVIVRSVEGQRVAYVIGANYHLEFVLEPSRDGRSLQFRDLSLERIHREGARETRGEILHASINVSMGRTHIVAVGKDEGAKSALFLVLSPEWTKPGPGILVN